jgi:hypothetical protein
MITQYENRVTSSFLLWLDHTVLDKGQAYTNFGSELYPVNSLYQGYYTFGAPYKQFVSDESINGANIPTGLYVNNVLTGTGVSPLVDINYEQGQGYFDSDVSSNTISGDYSVKDFSVHLTNMAEQEVLFETKISMRNSTSQQVTGLAPNVNTYPAIFIKNNGGTNYPFAFGGEEVSAMEFRAIVLADSQFKLDAVCSILKDQARTNVAIFPDEKYPYNALGGLKNGVYNYTGIVSEISDNVFINKVEVLRYNLGYMENLQNVNPNVFRAIIDFELEKPRFPRGE